MAHNLCEKINLTQLFVSRKCYVSLKSHRLRQRKGHQQLDRNRGHSVAEPKINRTVAKYTDKCYSNIYLKGNGLFNSSTEFEILMLL